MKCNSSIKFLHFPKRVIQSMISLFICSNAGGNVITEVALDFWRSGRERKEIRMTSKELEIKISEHINKNEKGMN